MTPIALLALAAGLSVDAFAAATAKGARLRQVTLIYAIGIGLMFGFMEALTPVIGWALGQALQGFVMEIDHWLAFGLLLAVGGHMAWRAIKELRSPPTEHRTDDATQPMVRRGWWGMALTALATSIDAAAVGVSLAFVDVNIILAALMIGGVTAVMATLGVLIGKTAGERLGSRAELAGGLVLIAIGCLILHSHLTGGSGLI